MSFLSVEEVVNIIRLAKDSNKFESLYCKENNININTFRHFKTKYNLNAEKGKHLNSRMQRSYNINDNYFDTFSSDSCYYAGFIAADGNIDSSRMTTLTIVLQKGDVEWIEHFREATSSNCKIMEGHTRNIYPYCRVSITSKNICDKLRKNFNITPKKSMTLEPPLLIDNEHVDSFIKGYIDGDGSIGLYNSKRQKSLGISIIGTEAVILWIKKRFEEILNKKVKNFRKKRNVYVLQVNDRNARAIFLHLYNLNTPCLKRKWKKEYYEHCINYKKYEDIDKYKLIQEMYNCGLNIYEIAGKLNCSYQNIYWYTKRPTYIKLLELNNKCEYE